MKRVIGLLVLTTLVHTALSGCPRGHGAFPDAKQQKAHAKKMALKYEKEAKEKLEEAFVKMDADQNGVLNSQEVIQWLQQSYLKMNLADTKRTMKTDDGDKDGFVSWEEYMDATYGMTEEELKKEQEQDGDDDEIKSLENNKKKFAAADENGDGKLGMEEVNAFLHPQDYKHMSAFECDRILGEYDSNDDGKIDTDEFIAQEQLEEMADEDLTVEKESFKSYDADGDGMLNKEEVLKWVSPNLEKIAIEEAAQLMEKTDKNENKELTVDEIKEQYELWTGGETDSDLDDYDDLLDMGHDEL